MCVCVCDEWTCLFALHATVCMSFVACVTTMAIERCIHMAACENVKNIKVVIMTMCVVSGLGLAHCVSVIYPCSTHTVH